MSECNEFTCSEGKRLFAELTDALKDLVEIQSSQMTALQLGDRKVFEFDEELRIALRAWYKARHVYMRHILDHGCGSRSLTARSARFSKWSVARDLKAADAAAANT